MNLKESKFRFAFESLSDNSSKLEIYHFSNQNLTNIDYRNCKSDDFLDIINESDFKKLFYGQKTPSGPLSTDSVVFKNV